MSFQVVDTGNCGVLISDSDLGTLISGLVIITVPLLTLHFLIPFEFGLFRERSSLVVRVRRERTYRQGRPSSSTCRTWYSPATISRRLPGRLRAASQGRPPLGPPRPGSESSSWPRRSGGSVPSKWPQSQIRFLQNKNTKRPFNTHQEKPSIAICHKRSLCWDGRFKSSQ